MKKLLICIVMALIGAAAALAVLTLVFKVDLTGGVDNRQVVQASASVSGADEGGELTDAELVNYAYAAAEAIKNRDYKLLSTFVHTQYGVVFAPYATVTLNSNKCFMPSQVAAFGDDTASYIWGMYDGSGNPIDMTPSEYFDAFVGDCDFTRASVIGIDRVIRTGNALENTTEAFPDARFVEFYIPGENNGGGDESWRTLRLVFDDDNGELRLSAIIHSQWTV